jgi:alkylation response protein AidB-like acyl-CoA dehydrogenase
MWEYPIARAYADARIVKIAGGSIEIMKTIIARQMYSQRGFALQKNEPAS